MASGAGGWARVFAVWRQNMHRCANRHLLRQTVNDIGHTDNIDKDRIMLAAVCHGQKDLRIEALEDRPLADGEVRVAVAFGGICGSDMHYYHRGAVGDFSLREPMVLGHEISGRVVELGAGVSGLAVGMKAALNPSRACLTCDWCRAGRSNLCADMKFLGSAGRAAGRPSCSHQKDTRPLITASD